MGRLIDADELIEFLMNVTITDGITFETGFKQILTDIKNQPTAYDVDKVVEQFDYAPFWQDFIKRDLTDNELDIIVKAIDIVEKGGK